MHHAQLNYAPNKDPRSDKRNARPTTAPTVVEPFTTTSARMTYATNDVPSFSRDSATTQKHYGAEGKCDDAVSM